MLRCLHRIVIADRCHGIRGQVLKSDHRWPREHVQCNHLFPFRPLGHDEWWPSHDPFNVVGRIFQISDGFIIVDMEAVVVSSSSVQLPDQHMLEKTEAFAPHHGGRPRLHQQPLDPVLAHADMNRFDEWGENPAVERLVAQRTTYQTDHGIGPLDRCTHSVRITDFTLDHLQLLVGQGHLARSSCKRPDSVPGFKQQRHDLSRDPDEYIAVPEADVRPAAQ